MDVRYALIGALVLPAGAWALTPRVGLDLGVTLGGSGGVSERVSLGITGSASATPGRPPYETYTTAAVGAFGDVRLAFDGSYRLTAGALGGITKGGKCDGFPIAGLGEVGVSLLHGGRPALHLGATAWLPVVQLRTFGALRSPTVAARESGLRLHGDRSIRSPGITVAGGPSIAFDEGCVMVGRPARDAEGRILLPEACGDDPAWLETARGEHSAVASFVDLALRLHALGAPRDLVGRVLHAAAEEAGHAVMAYLRAGTRTVAPLVLPHRPVAH
ncbi:MAG: hypothetical protein KC656_14570, partial [Myxococcales bacterium]|nr:hypothetical protein [Myxococcales bacterium]